VTAAQYYGDSALSRSQSTLVCLTSHHRDGGIRSMLAQSATAKPLGVDGMAALRFHLREQTRPCYFLLAARGRTAPTRAASCWLFPTAAKTSQGRHSRKRKRGLPVIPFWRRVGGESDGSDFDSPTSTSAKVEAVAENEFVPEPPA
jgi:hypothetical protein